MCPTCKKNTITRFGPYHPSYTMRWLFACQVIDKGCHWWTESNDPFAYKFFRAIGLEGKVYTRKEDPEDKKTTEQIHNEWRAKAGLAHLPFSQALQSIENKILTTTATNAL